MRTQAGRRFRLRVFKRGCFEMCFFHEFSVTTSFDKCYLRITLITAYEKKNTFLLRPIIFCRPFTFFSHIIFRKVDQSTYRVCSTKNTRSFYKCISAHVTNATVLNKYINTTRRTYGFNSSCFDNVWPSIIF